MTNKEAAWHLGTYSTTMGSGQTTDDQHNEAKRIAIKALEHITCADCEHYFFSDNRIPEERCFICDYWGKDNQEPTGYCNHAVRKARG